MKRPMKKQLMLFFLLVFSALAAEEEFKEGPGKDVVMENCSNCHSPKTVMQNRMDRAGWDKIIDKMQKNNGLWELSPEVRTKILDYLSQNYSPQAAVRTPIDGNLSPRKVNPLPPPVTK